MVVVVGVPRMVVVVVVPVMNGREAGPGLGLGPGSVIKHRDANPHSSAVSRSCGISPFNGKPKVPYCNEYCFPERTTSLRDPTWEEAAWACARTVPLLVK